LLTQLISRFPWYRGGEQQDAHELLRTLLGSISDDLSSVEKKSLKAEAPSRLPGDPTGCCEKTIWDNFRGHWAVSVLCWSCQKVTIRLDPFLDISLELPSTAEPPGALGVPAAARKAIVARASSQAVPARKEVAASEKVNNAEDERGDVDGDLKSDCSEDDVIEEGGASLSKREVEAQRKKRRQQRVQANQATQEAEVATEAGADIEVAGPKQVAEALTKLDLVVGLGIRVTATGAVGRIAQTNGHACKMGDIWLHGSDVEVCDVVDGDAASHGQTDEALRCTLATMRISNLRKQARALGADAAQLEAADDSDNSKTEFIELIVALQATRAVDNAAEGGDVEKALVAEEVFEKFEVQLSREKKSKDVSSRWGFEWDSEEAEQGRLVLTGVTADSILDKWNLKRVALGEQDRIVKEGDRLLEIAGCKKSRDKMVKALKDEMEVLLTFIHQAVPAASGVSEATASSPGASEGAKCRKSKKEKSKKGRGAAADEESGSDKEADKLKTAEAREARRRGFCEEALRCEKRLPEAVREAFSTTNLLEREANATCELSDCLRQFSGVEALEEDFAATYECSECSKDGLRCFASKRAWLWAPLPRLLTVQLKRFRRRGQRFEKNSARVATPAVLDLSDHVMSKTLHSCLVPHLAPGSVIETPSTLETTFRYELYGVCVHLGSSSNGGHYIAYVNIGCSLASEKWYSISDSQVSKSSRATALEAEAYVAFYRREGVLKESEPPEDEADEGPSGQADDDAGATSSDAEGEDAHD